MRDNMKDSNNALSYNALLAHILEKNLRDNQQRSLAGFATINGGTGLGKTSRLFQQTPDSDAPAILESVTNHGFKSIFVTHRWNILNDLYHTLSQNMKSDGSPFTATIIYPRDIAFKAAILQEPLPHEKQSANASYSINQFPNTKKHLDELKKQGVLSSTFWGINSYEKLDQIKYKILDRDNLQKARFKNNKAIDELTLEISNLCALFEHQLVASIDTLRQEIQKEARKNPDSSKNGTNDTLKTLQRKLDLIETDPWVQRILPALKWKLEAQDLLIMTTHKFFLSFFDGTSYQRLSKTSLKNYAIFIDEFDYQASELQKLLAEDQPIQELAECMGQIFFDSDVQMRNLAITHPNIYQPLAELREAFFQSLEEADIPLTNKRSLFIPEADYPHSHFLIKKQVRYLFKSDQLISNGMTKLVHTERGYDVYTKETDIPKGVKTIAIEKFIDIFEAYLIKFRRVLLQIEDDQSPDPEAQFRKLLDSFFHYKNDNNATYYSRTIPSISPYLLTEVRLPELKNVRNMNLIPGTYQNIEGFTVWAISSRAQYNEFETMRLQTKRALMETTSEALLLSLASRNLVIGLSATAYLNRAVNNFDLPWIKQCLQYIRNARTPGIELDQFGYPFDPEDKASFTQKPIPYVETKDDEIYQEAIIEHLSTLKQKQRDAKIELIESEFTFPSVVQDEAESLLDPIVEGFFQRSKHQNENSKVIHYRQSIVEKLIAICYMSTENKHSGQIAFVNSFHYFKKWLMHTDATESRKRLKSLKSHIPLQKTEHWQNLSKDAQKSLRNFINPNSEIFTHYLEINEKPLFLWFLDARCQKEPFFQEAYLASYQLNCPILIITQTASASNGINLDFYNSLNKREDLSVLYILEAQHFYFGRHKFDDASSERNLGDMALASDEIRDLYKYAQKYGLSNSKFSQYIPNIINGNQSSLNNDYKYSYDYCLNTMATLQQQIGRAERVWEKQTHATKVYLAPAIVQQVNRFGNSIDYSNNKKQLSHFNAEVIIQVQKLYEKRSQLFELTSLTTRTYDGQLIIEIIDELIIPMIQSLRQSENTTDAYYLHQIWIKLGDAVLRQQFSWSILDEGKLKQYNGQNPMIQKLIIALQKPLFEWACFKLPKDTQDLNEIWYNPQTMQFFNGQKPYTIPYLNNDIYDLIAHNQIIATGLRLRGYPISFNKHPDYVYNPTCEDQSSPPLVDNRYALHPYMIQRILKGRLGEKATEFLLAKNGFKIHEGLFSQRTFENYDIAIENCDYRIDAKLWSRSYMDLIENRYFEWRNGAQKINSFALFDAPMASDEHHIGLGDPSLSAAEKIESDPQKLIDKLKNIRTYEGNEKVLVIMNLYDHSRESEILGYDENLQPISPDNLTEASIITLNSALDRNNPDCTSPAFNTLRTLLSMNILSNSDSDRDSDNDGNSGLESKLETEIGADHETF